MKNYLAKLVQLEQAIVGARGPLALLALAERDEPTKGRDLLVAAPWLAGGSELASLRFLTGIIQETLGTDFLLSLSGVVILQSGDPTFQAIQELVEAESDQREFDTVNICGIELRKLHIVTSKRLPFPKQRRAERRQRAS